MFVVVVVFFFKCWKSSYIQNADYSSLFLGIPKAVLSLILGVSRAEEAEVLCDRVPCFDINRRGKKFLQMDEEEHLDPHGEMVQMHKCGFYPLGSAIEVGGDFNL